MSEPEFAPALVAIGNFDGVHLGHQALLHAAATIAAREKLACVALTFEPHPRAFFTPDLAPHRLTTPALKETLLAHYGAQPVTLPFDAALAGMEAPDFITQILQQRLNAKHVVIGQNFTFGRGRTGNAALLQQVMGADNVTIVPLAQGTDGQTYSSSRIRSYVTNGDFAAITALLGRPYIIEYGQNDILWPKEGEYAVFLTQNGDKWHKITLKMDQNGPISSLNPGDLISFSPEPPTISLKSPLKPV